MLIVKNWDNFILEKFGYNKIASQFSNRVIEIINSNLGRLILNKELVINDEIGNIGNINFINDTIIIKLSDRTYGNINPNSIIFKNKDINNIIINLELELSLSELKLKKLLDNKITTTIEHECLHIIERYLTIVNDGEFAISWKYGENLQKIQKKYKKSEYWNDILYFIYLSLPHEMRARLQQLNKEVENTHIKGIENVQDYIKTSKNYKDANFISELNIEFIISKLKIDENYFDIIKDFNLLFLENNKSNLEEFEMEFINYFEKIKNKNKKLIDKLLKISYNFYE